MIGPANHAGFFCFFPVAFKIRIYKAGTLGGFDKGKTELHVLYPHFFYFFPGNGALVAAHVNAVNFILRGNADAEFFVADKSGFFYLQPKKKQVAQKQRCGNGRSPQYKAKIFGCFLFCHGVQITKK